MNRVVFLGVLSAIFAAGCGGVSNTGDARLPDPIVKVFNLSPDTPSADFYLNDDLFAGAVEYASGTPDFKSVEFLLPNIDEGLYDVYAQRSGFLGDLDRITSLLERDKAFVFLTIGLREPGNELSKRLRLTRIEIERSRPVGNKANLLVVHGFCAAVGSETPSISLQTPGDNPQFSIKDIAFATSKTFEIDAGTYTFEARRADTDRNIYVTNSFNFQSGGLYLVAVTGMEGKTGSEAPRITFLQMSTK